MPSKRQNIVALVLALGLLGLIGWRSRGEANRTLDAGFWFEDVTYDHREAMTERLGGPLTAVELATIRAVAQAEVTRAFQGLPLGLSERRDATYRVRVVQELGNIRAPRYPGPAGESRVIAGFGGQGAVNFRMLVSSAVTYAPADADRPAIVAAIGRGVGRTAVHEFAHQFLRNGPVDVNDDRSSYEFRSADRSEQFYGELHWGRAWPLLQRRFGVPVQ
jgi:hypothetical protein